MTTSERDSAVTNVQIFLSTVSAEFRSYRDALRHDLTRHNVTVKVQKDFIPTGTETLDKLDEYIQHCDVVIHLVGDMTGALAQPPSVSVIRQKYPDFAMRLPVIGLFLEFGAPALSYTQWEAWLALYHKKVLIIAVPEKNAPRDENYQLIENQRTEQQAHLDRLATFERYPEIHFANVDRLGVEIAYSKLLDILAKSAKETGGLSDAIGRLRIAAAALLPGARRVWRISDIVAPVEMGLIQENKSDNSTAVSLNDITDLVVSGENVVLFGEGGIGKTTALLELADILLKQSSQRVALLVDAAIWAESKLSLLDYVAELEMVRIANVSLDELITISTAGRLTFLLNGWNEIPSSKHQACVSQVRHLMGVTPEVNVVLATRSVHDSTGLVSPKLICVKGLKWSGQTQVIKDILDKEQAAALINKLALDSRLRLAARNPFVLTGIIQLQRVGRSETDSLINILGAIVDQFESESQRSVALQGHPLFGTHIAYLEAIACAMNRKQGATLSVEQARTTISRTSKLLLSDSGQIEVPREPSDILKTLCNQHLIVSDGKLVRFAHQRFQEFYAAQFLLTKLTDEDCDIQTSDPVMLEAINWPFWADALFLVAEKLSLHGNILAKVRLIEVALQVDLSIACQLASIASLRREDAPSLFDRIVEEINRFWQSPIEQQREYALTCMVDSEFAVFGNQLLGLLEDSNSQVRLGVYRMGHSKISVSQLGNDVVEHVSTWPPEQRVEFVHEVAPNPNNFEFLVHLANNDPLTQVRAAAIVALAWEFPGSEAAINAWKIAPDEIKVDSQVLMSLKEDLMELTDSVGIDLIGLVERATDEAVILRLGLAFPDLIGSRAGDAVLQSLRRERHPHNEDHLLAFAHKFVPEQLVELAKELALSGGGSNEWVRSLISTLPPDERSELFAKALNNSTTIGRPEKLNLLIIGSCADHKHIHALVTEWLELHDALCERKREEPNLWAHCSNIEHLLASVNGDELLTVMVELGEASDYTCSKMLLGLISRNISNEQAAQRWAPSVEQVDELIRVFWNKEDSAPIPLQDVKAALCSIATHASVTKYVDYVLYAVRLELDSWHIFDECISECHTNPRDRRRLLNPVNSIILNNAVAKCGFTALPGLLRLLSHPSAHHLIPDAIAGVLAGPWSERRERQFMASAIDGAEAKMRRDSGRILQQPGSVLQPATDEAAVVLASILRTQLKVFDEASSHRPTTTNPQQVYRPNGDIVKALARIPSLESAAAVWDTLARGDFDEHVIIESVCALVRQGAFIEDERVVRQLERVCDKFESAKWLDDSARLQFNRVNQLFYFVRPTRLLLKPLTERLDIWQKKTYRNDVVRELQQLRVTETWDSLLYLAREGGLAAVDTTALFHAVVESVTLETFESFLSILHDGTFFGLSSNPWDMKRVAGHIAGVVKSNTGWRDELISICAESLSPAAEALACCVLKESNASEGEILAYGLKMLNAESPNFRMLPAFEMLLGMFQRRELYESPNQYSIFPQSSNTLRGELFQCAKRSGTVAMAARVLLLEIEASRREMGRPADEPLNPDIGLDLSLHSVLGLQN